MIRHENIHMSNIIQTDQAVFRINMYINTHTHISYIMYMDTMTSSEKRSCI